MASRTPVNAITDKLLTTTLADTTYTVPANTVFTPSACSFNNTTNSTKAVTANVYPSGGSASASNEVLTQVAVPGYPSAPVTAPSLVGHSFPAGTVFVFKADSAAAVSINLSGYLFTA